MSESFLNGRVHLHCGDCREIMAVLPENTFDAACCDPPYHLTSIVKRFGAENAAPIKSNLVRNPDTLQPIQGKQSTSQYSRLSTGFMGKQWDGGAIAFNPDTWRAVYRVLKPGAHLVAMGGTRTYHRMACAIEDAGFEIRDTISWLYGSGFPKSHDVSKGIDRAAGAERATIGPCPNVHSRGDHKLHEGWKRPWMDDPEAIERSMMATAPATDAARQWEGWHTALKPACELIVLARKPLSEGTVAANCLRWGTGAINVDGCRIGEDVTTTLRNGNSGGNGAYGRDERVFSRENPPGRWPANLCHDGSAEVLAGFPESGQAAETTGRTKSSSWKNSSTDGVDHIGHGDSGSAARFFFQAKQDQRCQLCNVGTVSESSSIVSTPTANSVPLDVADSQLPEGEDNAHQSRDHASNAASHLPPCHQPTAVSVLPSAQDWPLTKIVQNVQSAANLCSLCATDIAHTLAELRLAHSVELLQSKDSMRGRNAQILIQHLALYAAGRESTDTILTIPSLKQLFGSVFHAIETNIAVNEQNQDQAPEKSKRFWYGSKADQDSRLGSAHPTVKPLDLMQWLIRLVTPKNGTCLDCFAGTGTTGEAAWREGMRAVLIEAEPEYQADIRRRMALALAGPDERIRESIKAKNLPRDDGPLFDGLREAAE